MCSNYRLFVGIGEQMCAFICQRLHALTFHIYMRNVNDDKETIRRSKKKYNFFPALQTMRELHEKQQQRRLQQPWLIDYDHKIFFLYDLLFTYVCEHNFFFSSCVYERMTATTTTMNNFLFYSNEKIQET